MAKKQTRRSISVSRTTYERLKAFCETNNISMSQFVETRVGDFLESDPSDPAPARPVPPAPLSQRTAAIPPAPRQPVPPRSVEAPPQVARPTATPAPMTSAAARYAVASPPPVLKPKQETSAPKPAEKRPDQIFTF